MKRLVHRTLLAALASFSLALAMPALAQKVKLSTSEGDIVIELDAAKAPKTVDNFLQYVNAGHYDGTVFHRVIDNFMIQGGGMTADLKEKPTRAPIGLESRTGLTNKRGTVAMARSQAPNSVGSQFFIVLDDKDGDILGQANTYQIIGNVASGMDVADAIFVASAGVELPANPIPITTATVANP